MQVKKKPCDKRRKPRNLYMMFSAVILSLCSLSTRRFATHEATYATDVCMFSAIMLSLCSLNVSLQHTRQPMRMFLTMLP